MIYSHSVIVNRHHYVCVQFNALYTSYISSNVTYIFELCFGIMLFTIIGTYYYTNSSVIQAIAQWLIINFLSNNGSKMKWFVSYSISHKLLEGLVRSSDSKTNMY